MIVVSGEMELAEKDVEAARAATTAMAEETRNEIGCRTYAFFISVERPNVFRVFEEWDDDSALEAHFRSPHMARYREAMSRLEVRSRRILRYVVTESTEL